ncbi:MAG: hypothetical protein ABL973_12605 [Micropepsaceae bacterium]
MSFVAVVLGIFYVFAGVVALRVIALGSVMDSLLEALDGSRTSATEFLKTRILTIGAYLTAASGAALLTLSCSAVALFAANSLVQGGYLAWASRALVPEDDADRRGRQQTVNAFVIYVAATAFVIWLFLTNGLRAWPTDAVGQMKELIAPAVAMLGSWASIHVPMKRLSTSASGQAPACTPEPQGTPVNLRLQPDWQCHPLWDADTGDNVSQYALELPHELMDRIERWDDLFQDTYDGDDPSSSGFKSEHERQLYREEGKAIAAELAKVWPGSLEVPEQFR